MSHETIIKSVRLWLDNIVIAYNLCPFAKRERKNNRIRFAVTDADTEEQLLVALETELKQLNTDNTIETSLLIHPNILQDFFDYNQFLDLADGLLEQMELDGVYQIASFHPDYQFSGTEQDDAENYTNRSPYPLLHLLREASLEKAIASHPDTDKIPENNIKLLNEMGRDKIHALLQSCFNTQRGDL